MPAIRQKMHSYESSLSDYDTVVCIVLEQHSAYIVVNINNNMRSRIDVTNINFSTGVLASPPTWPWVGSMRRQRVSTKQT